MNIKITADSTCDLSPELIRKYDIDIIPLYIIKNGDSFRDGINITPEDIFDHVANGGDICTTSALNVSDYMEKFTELSPKYDAVIHINISAEFSACFQNATLAAGEFENVYAVDSRNLSTGSGHVVIEAAKMAKSGMDAKEIVQKLNELTGRVEASFVIDKLDYLKKGGRCSSLAALGANLLNLKPCIEVRDGAMHVAKKYKGSFEKSLKKYVKDRLEGRTDIDPSRIFITSSGCDPEVVRSVREAVEGYVDFQEIIETTAGCTISSHCGPNTLGILFMRKA
ncbi:MAG: DegV family protein [Christensenellales bacterium]